MLNLQTILKVIGLRREPVEQTPRKVEARDRAGKRRPDSDQGWLPDSYQGWLRWTSDIISEELIAAARALDREWIRRYPNPKLAMTEFKRQKTDEQIREDLIRKSVELAESNTGWSNFVDLSMDYFDQLGSDGFRNSRDVLAVRNAGPIGPEIQEARIYTLTDRGWEILLAGGCPICSNGSRTAINGCPNCNLREILRIDRLSSLSVNTPRDRLDLTFVSMPNAMVMLHESRYWYLPPQTINTQPSTTMLRNRAQELLRTAGTGQTVPGLMDAARAAAMEGHDWDEAITQMVRQAQIRQQMEGQRRTFAATSPQQRTPVLLENNLDEIATLRRRRNLIRD